MKTTRIFPLVRTKKKIRTLAKSIHNTLFRVENYGTKIIRISKNLIESSKGFWVIIFGESWEVKTVKILTIAIPLSVALFQHESAGVWTSISLFSTNLVYNISRAKENKRQ